MKKLLNLCLFLVFITSTLISTAQSQNHHLFSRSRLLLQLEEDDHHHDQPIITKKTTKNHSKLIKPSTSNSPKNQTKLPKTPNPSPKNQTKLPKNQAKDSAFEVITKNQTKLIKSLPTPPKNKTTKTTPSPPTTPKPKIKKPSDQSKIKPLPKPQIKKPSDQPKIKTLSKTHHQKAPEEPEEEDLVSEFTDLPSKFQETFLTKYNSQFTNNFKPYVGSRYASIAASFISFAFITIPLILVSLLFTKITAYFSLQKLILFIQIYLSIYFSILSLSALITNLEPLKLFYAAAQSAYVAVQVFQTLGYVLYLLLLIMYLVLVFSTESGAAARALALVQTAVGLAVGLHYYTAVFHRAVLRQPPRASWKVHTVYATCFVVICLLGRLDRRKKAYLQEGGEEGKKS
ncbi:hypothetical protein SASPL_143660 [Salvia splendens]|uniref:Uncharacterized protein n=2 Tax=Salvia splendens TaxID=180675 RepID=A0A8X8WM11_SALSN|nr:hypothetical protein SASPL_143660 [Salvia splendens]